MESLEVIKYRNLKQMVIYYSNTTDASSILNAVFYLINNYGLDVTDEQIKTYLKSRNILKNET